ncbi:MAG: YtxH domain-containing protein [Candidatus Obscuribacterales bacterium]|nr:YtxH domain-containing protein [Candidatus Obscuribacterales bacterium]
MGNNAYPYQHQDSDSGFGLGAWLIGLLIGAAGGVTLGLLTAPKSGKELRGELKEGAMNLPDRCSELMDDTLDLYASGVNYAQLAVEEQTMRVKRAVAAGKLAAAKKREELDYSSSSVLPFQHN